jgi:hypothetical protein
MRWVGHVAFMGEIKNAYQILVQKPERKRHLKYLCVDWRIILK